MTKIDFQHFSIPTDISRKGRRIGDARESFANMLYLNVNGIRAHALAMKIYGSEGEIEYSDEEVNLIKNVAEQLCAPNFIDGLKEQLECNEDRV